MVWLAEMLRDTCQFDFMVALVNSLMITVTFSATEGYNSKQDIHPTR
jgi:hypothetical protein